MGHKTTRVIQYAMAQRTENKGAVFFEYTDFSERLSKDQHGTLTDRVACTHDRDAVLKL